MMCDQTVGWWIQVCIDLSASISYLASYVCSQRVKQYIFISIYVSIYQTINLSFYASVPLSRYLYLSLSIRYITIQSHILLPCLSVCLSVFWSGLVWSGMAWHGMAWHGMAWHGMYVRTYTYNHVYIHISAKRSTHARMRDPSRGYV